MLQKFMRRILRPGDPVSRIDATGIARMDHAWATLDVLDGEVNWSPDGRPTIIAPGAGSTGARLFVYQATDDASYSSGQWSVPAKRVNLNGTLDGDAESRAAITVYLDGGDPDPTFPPVRNHQRFVLVTTADGVRAAFVSNLRDALSLQTREDNGRLEIDGWSTRAVTTVVAEDALVVRRVVDDQRVVRYVSVEDLIAYVEDNISIDWEDISNRPTIPGEQDGFDSGTDPDNRDHHNLSGLTTHDDHNGGRTPVEGTTGKNLYLHPEGDATRNAMPGVIGNADGQISIDPTYRHLHSSYATANEPALDYEDGRMYSHRALTGATTRIALDWMLRRLYDHADESRLCMDWELRRMYDQEATPKLALDWGLRQGYNAADGSTPSLDWSVQQVHIEDARSPMPPEVDGDGTTGTATEGMVLGPVGDTSAGDESAAINDNFASLHAYISVQREELAGAVVIINKLRDALQAYKIIAEPEPEE